jgi:hypothetical protein
MLDVRDRLRHADDLTRQGMHADAIAIYQSVADEFLTQGARLKAIALSRSVVQIVDKAAPELVDERARAIRRLADLLT